MSSVLSPSRRSGDASPTDFGRRGACGRWLTALGLGLALAGFAPALEAEAAERAVAADDSPEPNKTRYGFARMSWDHAPPLQLQPERARITLQLPPEWMPAPAMNLRGLHIATTMNFELLRNRSALRAVATVGSRIHLHLTAEAVDFGLSLSPRSAVAILRFDPIAWVE